LRTAYALKCFDDPYCLRAIENKLFASERLPIKGKQDSTLSIFKNFISKLNTKITL